MQMKCFVCEKVAAFQCTTCKIACYCGKECQIRHRFEHKNTCKSLKDSLDVINREEMTLRLSPTANFFVDKTVNFWMHMETFLYMRTRVSYFYKLDEIGTEPALREAIAQGKIMIQEGRGDNPGVRYLMPSMYLRLDDPRALQECYDFIKCGDLYADRYDLEVIHQSTQTDMCEALYSEARHGISDLYNIVGLAIIKMRLLSQLQQHLAHMNVLFGDDVSTNSKLRAIGANRDLVNWIGAFLLPVHSCFAVKRVEQLRVLEERLQKQVRVLFRAAERHDDRMWKIFVDPSKVRENRAFRFPGSTDRILSVALCYKPFFNRETEGGCALRQMLVDRVGGNPKYKFSVVRASPTSVQVQP